MSRKDVILEQILYCHNKNGWFVSFNNAIDGLSEEQAAWKKSESENSIWEIVNHLVFWNLRYLNRFKGIPNEEMKGNNDTTFLNQDGLIWDEVVQRYNLVMSEWYDTINHCEDSKLNQPVQPESDSSGSWVDTLSSITLHNAYHIGQIVTIRKMQESWRREQGVH